MSNLHMTDTDGFWQSTGRRTVHSRFVRYGGAIVLTLLAALLTVSRPALGQTLVPFLGAVVLSALWSGLGPAFISTALSSLLIRLLLEQPRYSLNFAWNAEGMERMGLFMLMALMIASLAAAMRRERNQLSESEERFRDLAETASDAIVVIDDSGVIRFANPGAERIFGEPVVRLTGKALTAILPAPLLHFSDLKSRFNLHRKAVAVELPARLENGKQVLLEMTFGAFSRHGKDLFTAIIRDITARARPGALAAR